MACNKLARSSIVAATLKGLWTVGGQFVHDKDSLQDIKTYSKRDRLVKFIISPVAFHDKLLCEGSGRPRSEKTRSGEHNQGCSFKNSDAKR